MQDKWCRTPKYIMRKDCIKYISKDWEPSSFIEFGPGNGNMTIFFLENGYSGICYDIGDVSRDILQKNLRKFKAQIEVVDNLENLKYKYFNYLFAFEVLEHIENDREALYNWSQYLNHGGKLLISVPAHMKKYSKEDESVGHIRRYEKNDLRNLLNDTGYKEVSVLNYGFPIGNVTRLISNYIHKKENIQDMSMEARSIRSGIRRPIKTDQVSFLFKDSLFKPLTFFQKFFFNLDVGDGYIISAIKR